MKTFRFRKIAITLLMLACAAQCVFAAIISGPVTNSANGHIYYLLTQNTWTASEAEAQTLGGHLVTINDQAEQDWVLNTFAAFGGVDRALWIGLTDRYQEGAFSWSSGEPLGYTHWQSPPQPDNGSSSAHGAENYVHMLWPGSGLDG